MDYWYPLAVPTIGDAEIAAATDVLRSGHTTMGDKVAEFEERFAHYVGARYGVMVNSGSSADLLIAFSQKGRKGDVLVPAVTWPTHFWSWKMAGFKPVLVDVEGLNTPYEILLKAMDIETVGASVVHLMGQRAGGAPQVLWLTEDCCEAVGPEVIGRGSVCAWSFFFSHHLTTMEGGMVTTDSHQRATEMRVLRSHGWARPTEGAPLAGQDPRYTFIDWGFNLRPTEVAAAIGLVQLERLPDFNVYRTSNYNAFHGAMRDVEQVELPLGPGSPWFGIPMFVRNRHSLRMWLENHGVETRPILGGNLARQPAFARHATAGPLPGADRVHDQGLYIGLHPDAVCPVERVAELIVKWARR